MSIARKSEHTGSSFGTPTPEPDSGDDIFGPPVNLNAVNAARPRPRHLKEEAPASSQQVVSPAQPATPTPPQGARLVPVGSVDDFVPEHMRVAPGHAPISDKFGGFNRYVGGSSIALNQYGGLDVGRGGPDGAVYTGQMVHIHTMMVLTPA